MITQKDALNIAKAINNAYSIEIKGQTDYEKIATIRGMRYRALSELWYEVFTNKLKAEFEYNFTYFVGLVDCQLLDQQKKDKQNEI